MRPKVLAAVILILSVGVVLIWLFRDRQSESVAREESAEKPGSQTIAGDEPVDKPTSVERGDTAELKGQQRSRIHIDNTNLSLAVASEEDQRRLSNDVQRAWDRINDDLRWSIDFYGRVLDENMNPVPEADAHFSWTVAYPNGPAQRETKTDTQGLFGLTGVTGNTLSVSVSKQGYYSVKKGQPDFAYSKKDNAIAHNGDPNNPVIFYLRKKGPGTILVTSQYGVFPELEFSGPRDGSTTRVDFFNRKVGSEGQMELSAIKPPRGQTASEWSFRLSIPDGGLVEENDEFPFEAPESGYQPTIEFNFKASETNWTDTLRKHYYIVFGQPPKYGRIDLETGIYMGINLRYAVNPDGSRYLEPKEKQYEGRPPTVSGAVQVIPKMTE